MEDNSFQHIEISTIEECSELIKAITKMLRFGNDEFQAILIKEFILEEMADVYICLEKLERFYGFNAYELPNEINKKKNRGKQNEFKKDIPF